MLARLLLKRSHYKDPTYIRYLFYFKDRLWGLVEDYNALAPDFKTETVSLPEVEANFNVGNEIVQLQLCEFPSTRHPPSPYQRSEAT